MFFSRLAGRGGGPRARTVESLERRTLLSVNPMHVDPLDPTFGGGDGMVTDAGPDLTPTALAVQGDGKLVAVGHRFTPNDLDFVVARYNADGTVDPTFGQGGRVFTDFDAGIDQPMAVEVMADGRIVVAGMSYYAGYAVARYNPDGSLDATFDGDGKVVRNDLTVSTLDVMPDGRILLGGSKSQKYAVARLNADGSRDTAFDGDGVATYGNSGDFDQVSSLAVQGDGKVLVTGTANVSLPRGGSYTTSDLFRFNADGSFDSAFGATQPSGGQPMRHLTIAPSGKAYFDYAQQTGTVVVSGFDPQNISAPWLRGTFPLSGTSTPWGLWLRGDGSVLVGVNHQATGATVGENLVGRLTPAGAVDTTFGGGDGLGTLPAGDAFDKPVGLVLQPSGRTVALGTARVGTRTDFALAALDAAGAPEPSFYFSPAAYPVGYAGDFSDVVALPDGRFLALGNTAGGAMLARFLPDGSPDLTFGSFFGQGSGKVIRKLGGEVTRMAVKDQSFGPHGDVRAIGSVLTQFRYTGEEPTPKTAVPVNPAGDGIANWMNELFFATSGGAVVRYNGLVVDASFPRVDLTNVPIGHRTSDDTNEPYAGFIATDVAFQPYSGKLVVVGHTNGGGSSFNDWAAIRLDPQTGALDRSFGIDGMVARHSDIDYGGRATLGADGTIYMAGNEDDDDAALVVFERDGRNASDYRLPFLGSVADVAVGADGRVFLVGTTTNQDPDRRDIVVARFDRDSAAGFVTFQTNVSQWSDDHATGVAVAADGDVLVTGVSDDKPLLLRYRAEAFDAPQVRQVFAGSSQWTPAFRQFLVTTDRVSNGAYGRGMFNGDQPRPEVLPWTNLDQVVFNFDRPVSVAKEDLRVRGVNVPQYTIGDFHYDAADRTAVWTLAAPIGADKVVAELDPAKFGPNYSLRLNVLPGDVDGSGQVLAADFGAVNRSFFRSTTDPGTGNDVYSPLLDVNGSGQVLADDFSDVKRRFFTQLPGGEPTAAATAFASTRAGPARRSRVTDEVLLTAG